MLGSRNGVLEADQESIGRENDQHNRLPEASYEEKEACLPKTVSITLHALNAFQPDHVISTALTMLFCFFQDGVSSGRVSRSEYKYQEAHQPVSPLSYQRRSLEDPQFVSESDEC